MEEALELEIEFINESLPCNLIGMDNIAMTEYVKFIADHLLQMLGQKKHWNATNPFPWMDLISMEVKTNFLKNGYLITANPDLRHKI